MYTTAFGKGLRVLAIGPHSDDIELGCAGTLLWLITQLEADVYYRVLSTARVKNIRRPTDIISREEEARNAAEMLGIDISDLSEPKHFEVRDYPDTQFPQYIDQIHKYLEETKELVDPHIVFAPSTNDAHQDHIAVAKTVLRVFREGQTILHYEIRQFHSSHFLPNLYVDVSAQIKWQDGESRCFAEQKNRILQKCFKSQKTKMYLDSNVIMANMVMRGQQCGPTVKYAEAFQSRLSLFDYKGIASS